MTDLAITNARVVLADEVLEGGMVLIEEGRIAEVRESSTAPRGGWTSEIDAHGAYLIPGLVDLHNDGLEMEVRPRPHAELPLDLAFPTYERRLVGSGVTTEFHAISFMDQQKANRTVSQAALRAAYVAKRQRVGGGAVQHHVLHRVDVWSAQYLDDVFESIDALSIGYLSINDHTPGQGQFNDIDKYLEIRDAYTTRGHQRTDRHEVLALIAERTSATAELRSVYARIAAAAREKGIVIASHDDDSVEKVNMMHALGARIAEFPVTIEAARRARELGMAIAVGAPNIVRGGSQSGNLDAQAMFQAGLADIICADYHAPSLLPSAFRLVDEGVTSLPAAIRALTLNPARAVGLEDRGTIAPDQLADLNLIRLEPSGVPHVEATFRRGQPVFRFAGVAAGVFAT